MIYLTEQELVSIIKPIAAVKITFGFVTAVQSRHASRRFLDQSPPVNNMLSTVEHFAYKHFKMRTFWKQFLLWYIETYTNNTYTRGKLRYCTATCKKSSLQGCQHNLTPREFFEYFRNIAVVTQVLVNTFKIHLLFVFYFP